MGRVREDDAAVHLSRRMQSADRVDRFSCLPALSGERRTFVVDVRLVRLASYLFFIGIGTFHRDDSADDGLARIPVWQPVTLLSRDTGRLRRAAIMDAALIYSMDAIVRLMDVADRLQLRDHLQPFTRADSSGKVEPVGPALARDVRPKVRQRGGQISRCRACTQLCWHGTREARLRGRFVKAGSYIRRGHGPGENSFKGLW